MDNPCLNCGEPWDAEYIFDDTLRENELDWDVHDGLIYHCPCCTVERQLPDHLSRKEAAGAVADIMCGDVDGMVSFMEDFEERMNEL